MAGNAKPNPKPKAKKTMELKTQLVNDRETVVGVVKDGVEYPAFRMFDPDARGKKSSNAPCVVAYEKVDFSSLSEDQKDILVMKLIREEARTQYDKKSKGYEAMEGYLKAVKSMLADYGIDVEAEPEKVRQSAVNLALKDGVELAFEPVTEMFLTKAQIIGDSTPVIEAPAPVAETPTA